MADSVKEFYINCFGSFVDPEAKKEFLDRLKSQNFKVFEFDENKVFPKFISPILTIHIIDDWAWLCFLSDVSIDNPNLVINVWDRDDLWCWRTKIQNGKHTIWKVETTIPEISEEKLEKSTMVSVNWPAIKKDLGISLEEPEDGNFNIAAVSRNDIQEMLITKMGIDSTEAAKVTNALSTETMHDFALRLSNEYFNYWFWSSLQSVFTSMFSKEEISVEEFENVEETDHA